MDAYLLGMNARRSGSYDGFRRAVSYFEQAIAIQQDFGEAHAELALAQLQFLFTGPVSPDDAIPKAELHAREALHLDKTLGQAHLALGQILTLYHWQWDEGERSLERAAALTGGRRSPLSVALARRGLIDEAVAMAVRGRMLDPLSVQAHIAVGTAYRTAGQYDRAIEALRIADGMSPRNSRVLLQWGVTLVKVGRFAEAIPVLKEAEGATPGHNPRIEAYIGYAYAAAGRTKEAREVLAELEDHGRTQYVSSFGIALIHEALGEPEPALAALQRAYDDRAVEFAFMDDYPKFKAIASKPRFQSVMQSVGLPR
jgi:serine/threonine-protein kinase